MSSEYQNLLRLVVKLLFIAAMVYGVYRRKKKTKAMLGQAAQELKGNFDDKLIGNSKFVFPGADGETCQVWVTGKNGTIPSHLYLQINRSPLFKFTCKTKRAFSSLQPWDLIPRGQVIHLGVEVDYRAKLRARDPVQAEFHFSESKRRQALISLLQAGFNSITADGTKMIAIKDKFTAIDLGPENLRSYANALCSLG